MFIPPDDEEHPSELINPAFIESALFCTFPGAPVQKAKTINNRNTYLVEFVGFALNVSTESEGINRVVDPHTRAKFRRHGDIHKVEGTFRMDQRDELLKFFRDARAYVMGLYVALNQVLFLPEEPDKPSIFDGD